MAGADVAQAADREAPRCLVRDDHGNDACDRPAEFIVWGHLYEKAEKGPRCGRHLPESAYFPGAIDRCAIYRIPTGGDTASTEVEWGARTTWPDGHSAIEWLGADEQAARGFVAVPYTDRKRTLLRAEWREVRP